MPEKDVWKEDLLEFRKIGEAYTRLIKTVDEAKVISVEAGFGQGKTFFRERWAEQVRAEGEVVIEIDAQRSDHSGDPVVTFIAALVAALPEKDPSRLKKGLQAAKKAGVLAGKTGVRLVARNAAEEVFEAIGEGALDKIEDMDALKGVMKDLGEGMSKAAGEVIAAQMTAEKVRNVEMPKQLRVLRETLTEGHETDRVVILIDELDRCHPDYAIAVLEAMKLVFDQPGFVFVLFVNAEYLENLAKVRFGIEGEGERYLDKFVDLRLGLPVTEDVKAAATRVYALEKIATKMRPFGSGHEFTAERAAGVAGEAAKMTGLSFRQTKRILQRVEIALRIYSDRNLDCPLLIVLAFRALCPTAKFAQILPRFQLTPERAQSLQDAYLREIGPTWMDDALGDAGQAASKFVSDDMAELLRLPHDRYPIPQDGNSYYPWFSVISFLAPHYIPSHQAMLDAVAELEAPGSTDP